MTRLRRYLWVVGGIVPPTSDTAWARAMVDRHWVAVLFTRYIFGFGAGLAAFWALAAEPQRRVLGPAAGMCVVLIPFFVAMYSRGVGRAMEAARLGRRYRVGWPAWVNGATGLAFMAYLLWNVRQPTWNTSPRITLGLGGAMAASGMWYLWAVRRARVRSGG